MTKTVLLAAAIASLALPAFAQTTTTVTTEQQPQAAPPPPPPPTTQVVVNPSDAPPPPRTSVRVDGDATGVETVPSGRSAVAIVATDALYGGVAGALIGGGVTLIDQGNNWQRNLMVGAGIGVLAGAAFGVYEAATQQPRVVTRAAADRDPAASDSGVQVALAGGRF